MINTENAPERILVVGVHTEKYQDELFEVLMSEMKALIETAGGIPVDAISQKLERLDKRTAIGSGKVQEVKFSIEKNAIDTVIFLNELTPSMNRHLEEALEVKVIDRIQLILDIFALRAKSKEGKLQVELAQYDYLLPRLHGKGKSLSRLGGGIGTRGPGETKLENDRRHIRSIMNTIKKELAQLSDHRERTRLKRRNGREFNIGLVGYTNVGKSSILRALTKSETYVQDQLFATLDPLTRQFEIKGHDAFTLTDTVGFIEELPTSLIQAFKSTLEEMRYVDLLLHVIDASSPHRLIHEQTVIQLMKELEMTQTPILTVYNKMDQLKTPFEPTLFPFVAVSILEEDGVIQLKEKIWQTIVSENEVFKVEIQPSEAELLALYRNKTLVQTIDFDEEKQIYYLTGVRRKMKESE